MDQYIDQCKELSMTARMAIGLLVLERFCEYKNIKIKQITDFTEYLWEWPLVGTKLNFDVWEASRTELVSYGLGDNASNQILDALKLSNVEELQFRNIVEGVVEILWGSFWGGVEDELSLNALRQVIRSSKLEKLPVLTPFRFSKFKDMNGYGTNLDVLDRDFWKCNSVFV